MKIKPNAVNASSLPTPPLGYYTPKHFDFLRFKSVLEEQDFWFATLEAKDQAATHRLSSINIRKSKWLSCGPDGEEKRSKSSLRDDDFYAVFFVVSLSGNCIEGTGGRLHAEPFFDLKGAMKMAEEEAIRREDKWIVTRTSTSTPTLYRKLL